MPPSRQTGTPQRHVSRRFPISLVTRRAQLDHAGRRTPGDTPGCAAPKRRALPASRRRSGAGCRWR
jgi:hypothetical protein